MADTGLDFITAHADDWANILTNAPYNLRHTMSGELHMLKYSQIDSDLSLPIVQEARGCIFAYDYEYGEYRYIARPFDKFFNFEESNAAAIDWAHATASMKIDGSLIKVFYHRGWHIATNGTIDAYNAAPANITNQSFGMLFQTALKRYYIDYSYFFKNLDKHSTYMFELVSPISRVVLEYDETDCYYLGSRRNVTGEYWDDDHIVIQRPAQYDASSLESVLRQVEQMEGHKLEGIVVFDGVNRIKCKTREYFTLHHLANNGAMTWERLIDIVLNHDEEEFLSYFKFYANQIDTIRGYMNLYKSLADGYADLYSRIIKDMSKKDFAELIQYRDAWLKSYLFKWYDTGITWDNYCGNWDATRWARVLDFRIPVVRC